MITSHSPLYQKAFRHYLRYGIPVEISLKAFANEAKALFPSLHPTPYYIWRTRGDNRVRPTHRANDGKIFAWANPPATGNPGHEYRCRCWAEPYYSPLEVLNPGGMPIGRSAPKPDILTMPGGEKAARALYERLSKGGKPESRYKRAQGVGMRLPNGDWVGYRPVSKSGPPTIDLDIKGFPYNKIKFPD